MDIKQNNKIMPYQSKSIKIVHHKIAERRMEGAGGGAFAAFVETAIRDNFYFSGPVYDESFHVRHILTNDPEKLSLMTGRKITESTYKDTFPEIRTILESGKSVLFSGTPCQCKDLREYLEKDFDRLITIDFFCTGVFEDIIIDKYIEEIEKDNNSKITDIHFFNKEFTTIYSKRISLNNGRTIYPHYEEPIDQIISRGCMLKGTCAECPLTSFQKRYADISLGSYDKNNSIGDRLGYSSVSINSDKGELLYNKALKRLVVYKDTGYNEKLIDKKPIKCGNIISVNDLYDVSLSEYVKRFNPKGVHYFKAEIRKLLRIVRHEVEISRCKPGAILKFFKYNFFTKGIKTSFKDEGYMYIAPYSELQLAKGASIELHGPMEIGVKRVRRSRLETRLWMKPGTKIIVYHRCMLGYGSNIEIIGNGVLEVGTLLSNAPFTIICGSHIKLGDSVNIAKDCTIRDTNGHFISNMGFKQLRPVEIGNHVWIASGSMIMPGVTIGDGCIIGSMSYVNKSKKPFTISQGNPAIEESTVRFFRT